MTDDSNLGWGTYSDNNRDIKNPFDGMAKYEDWARTCIMDMPWYGSGTKYHWYGEDFVLDVKELERRAEYRFTSPTNEEFRAMARSLPPGEVKQLADGIFKAAEAAEIAKRAQDLLDRLDEDPMQTLKDLNSALAALVVRPDDSQYEDFRMPKFSIANAGRYEKAIKEITLEETENKLVQVKGWLTYVQDPVPERIVYAEWTCRNPSCGAVVRDYGNRRGQMPGSCGACHKSMGFDLTEKRSEKFQECILTENFEDSSGFPTSMKIILANGQTGIFAPGDRISATGVVKAEEVKTKSGQILFQHAIEVITARRIDDRSVVLAPEDRRVIEEFSRKPNVLEALAERFAPYIIGHEAIKKALILQAAGSPDEVSGSARKRGQIHVLLVGDPGLGKSQLLRAMSSLAPKALYVTDASAAGLTAAVVDVAGKKVMTAGVLVLADGGIAAIDELDKMKQEDREGIHTAMEQGFIAKSKAGLHANFQARTSVLAAANPKWGRFDAEKPIPEQITLEAPLLNRFDLIFVMVDRASSDSYEKDMAMQMLQPPAPAGDDEFLRKYISMCREIDPALTRDVAEKISAYYSKMRRMSGDAPVNPRTLEALKRLTKASARIRLSRTTGEEDLANAMELVEAYLQQFSFNVDAISGITKSLRDLIYAVRDFVAMRRVASTYEIEEELKRMGADRSKARRIIEELHRTGTIYQISSDRWGVAE